MNPAIALERSQVNPDAVLGETDRPGQLLHGGGGPAEPGDDPAPGGFEEARTPVAGRHGSKVVAARGLHNYYSKYYTYSRSGAFLPITRLRKAIPMLLPVLLALTAAGGGPRPAHPLPVRPALTDANIIAIFDAANTYDIATGMLGEQHGSTKEVRAVATALIRDHKAVQQQGRDLAKKLGVTPMAPAVNPLAAQHAKALTELKGLSGVAFDRAFLDHEIAYHQAVIDAVTRTLLPAIQNAELKAFVERVAPAFQAHLDMCKAARSQVK